MIQHSFALIAYKDSPYLTECLDSLRDQTVKSLIYISTSTPSSFIVDVAKKYGVELYITNPNKGIAHDWNFALQNCKTKYVTLAHQDDLYKATYTEECLSYMSKYEDALICFTNYSELIKGIEYRNNFLVLIKRFILKTFMPIENQIRNKSWKKLFLAFGCPVAAPSVIYNLENLKEFTFSNAYSVSLDWDSWYKMSQMNGKFLYLNKLVFQHRIHKESATSLGIAKNIRYEEDLKMFKRFWPNWVVSIISKMYAISYKLNRN